jgi:hypothetical protein
MVISFDLPESLERQLRASLGNLERAAKEAAMVELYRQGRINRRELGVALDLSRFAIDDLLKTHNVTEDLLTPEEHAAQLERLSKLVGR